MTYPRRRTRGAAAVIYPRRPSPARAPEEQVIRLAALLEQIDAGLYRWTAPHPEWDPVADQLDSSYQEVASHLIVGSESAVFVDPLAPTEPAEPFWGELDDLIAPVRGSLAVVLTLHWHERSAAEFAARYTAPVYAPAGAANEIEHRPLETYVPKRTGPAEEVAGRAREAAREAAGPLPLGLEPFYVGRDFEAVLWLPSHRALLFADVVLSTQRGLRMCPEDWVRKSAGGLAPVRRQLLPLLELPISKVLTAHGPPLLSGGREALEDALRSGA